MRARIVRKGVMLCFLLCALRVSVVNLSSSRQNAAVRSSSIPATKLLSSFLSYK